jgi:hypothetical protein
VLQCGPSRTRGTHGAPGHERSVAMSGCPTTGAQASQADATTAAPYGVRHALHLPLQPPAQRQQHAGCPPPAHLLVPVEVTGQRLEQGRTGRPDAGKPASDPVGAAVVPNGARTRRRCRGQLLPRRSMSCHVIQLTGRGDCPPRGTGKGCRGHGQGSPEHGQGLPVARARAARYTGKLQGLEPRPVDAQSSPHPRRRQPGPRRRSRVWARSGRQRATGARGRVGTRIPSSSQRSPVGHLPVVGRQAPHRWRCRLRTYPTAPGPGRAGVRPKEKR